MKKLFLSGLIAGLSASPAQADEGFGYVELRSLARSFEEARCQTRCDTSDWVIERVAMPRGARTVAPDERLYLVYTQPHGCGAGSCYEAFVLRDSSSLTVIKHGLAISVSPLRASEIPALARRNQLTRMNRVSRASIGLPVRSSSRVTVEVIRPVNVRTAPTARGSTVLATLYTARFSGEWIKGTDGTSRWLKVASSEIDEMDTARYEFLYVAGENLRVIGDAK